MMNKLFTLLLSASCFTATAQVPDYVPTDGLVGWFDFAGDADNGLEDGVNGESSEVGFGPDRFGNPSSALQIPVLGPTLRSPSKNYQAVKPEQYRIGQEGPTTLNGRAFAGVIYNVQGCCGLGSFACGANIYEKGVRWTFNGVR